MKKRGELTAKEWQFDMEAKTVTVVLTVEEMRLQLAEKLESLREPCLTYIGRPMTGKHIYAEDYTCGCDGVRGWVPKVTLEGLIVAMDEANWKINHIRRYVSSWAFTFGSKGDDWGTGYGELPNLLEAAMKAALEALA